MVLDDINKDNPAHQIQSEVIDRACYDIDMNSDNTEVEVDVTPIDSTNDKTCIYQNQYVNVVHNHYVPFL